MSRLDLNNVSAENDKLAKIKPAKSPLSRKPATALMAACSEAEMAGLDVMTSERVGVERQREV